MGFFIIVACRVRTGGRIFVFFTKIKDFEKFYRSSSLFDEWGDDFMIKALGRRIFFVISRIITRFRSPKKKVKEVVNVKYSIYKKAG
nr:hypothetical protein [Sporomusa silvacetica]